MMPDEDEDRAEDGASAAAEEPGTFAGQFETREQAFREARAELDWLDLLAP